MAVTLQQLQARLDAINQAIGDPTWKSRMSDGREVTGRTIDELRKAKAEIEEDIREMSGATGGRVRLAQTKRGNGPSGPDRWWW